MTRGELIQCISKGGVSNGHGGASAGRAEVTKHRPGQEEMNCPNNLSPCTIGEVCEFESGNGFRPQDWRPHGLPIIRIQNLNGSGSFNYFAGEPDPAWIVEPGDLLFAWAGVKGVSFGRVLPRFHGHIKKAR